MMGSRSTSEAAERAPLLPSNVLPVSRERKRTCRCRCVTLIGSLSVIALIFVALSFLGSTSEPTKVPPNGTGIGISLSTHYGTIAIRHEDGSITNAGRVEASGNYVAMLQRLSRPESQHPSPPYDSLSDAYRDRWRQWVRSGRKKLGFPASRDVEILIELLRQLVSKAEESLPSTQKPLTSAVVTLPNVIALYPEDAYDALEFLGIQALSGHNVYTVPRALPGAYAGYGRGLCSDPDDLDGCANEEDQMLWQAVVSVEMNLHSFAADSRMMSTPMYVFDERRAVLDWGAGLDRIYVGEEYYWNLVRTDIKSVMEALNRTSGRLPGEPVIDEVLMMGDAADDERVVEVVREAISSFQDQNATIHLEQPQYVAARGAAELAKRLLIQGNRPT